MKFRNEFCMLIKCIKIKQNSAPMMKAHLKLEFMIKKSIFKNLNYERNEALE